MNVRFRRAVYSSGIFFSLMATAQSAEIALVPVGASGPHQIAGNQIHVEAGTRVFLEMQVSGWDPDMNGDPLLALAQGGFDASGFTSGDVGALTLPVVACAVDADCEAMFGPGALCGRAGIPNQCDFGFTDRSRPDRVFGCGGSEIYACSVSLLACGGVIVQGPPGCVDPGIPQYLTTIVLDVSSDANGTFTVGFVDDPTKTFMVSSDNVQFAPLTLTPALISIGIPACCLPTGGCSLLAAGACAAVGGAFGASCLGDGDGDGVDDGCQADCDGDGVPDIDEVDPAVRDCDLDGICNGLEIAACAGDPACADCNGDSIPDGCQVDCNGNDVEDSCDIANLISLDCNGNGVPDECEYTDCNFNGVPDECDISSGGSVDCDGDGVPDECQIGACCLDPDGNGFFEGCTDDTKSACEAASGIFRGPCQSCPAQNVSIIPEPGGDVFVHVIGAPIDCLAATSLDAVGCSPTGPFNDVWKSDANASMCHNFGAFGQTIPADFFAPGSDPFTSSVCLEGVPLGLLGLGEADTIIRRSADPFDRCGVLGFPSTVDIEVTALSLKSVSSITVTFNGGQTPELWDVTVDLSSVAPPVGSLTAVKTHCNGGTYTSVLNVQPRFTFTKVSDPTQVRVLDTGLEGMSFITLNQQVPTPWVHDLDPGLGLTGDPCTAFHPGVEDQNQTTSCDCNGNSIRDKCDIETAQSQDCNLNGVPDSCDIGNLFSTDCDGNSMPDECQPDCNGNSVADACDILAATFQDANSNTIPDVCERGAASPVADVVAKSRYVSFRPGGAVGGVAAPVVQALRVTSTDFPGWARWLGVPDADGIARLQCTPVFRDWGFGKLHATGRGILPNKAYVVQGIAVGGDAADNVPYSDPPTAVPTLGIFGDIVPPTGGAGQPNFGDITAAVRTFQEASGALPVPIADLAPEEPDQKVNFADISALVGSFKGLPYPFGQPVLCP